MLSQSQSRFTSANVGRYNQRIAFLYFNCNHSHTKDANRCKVTEKIDPLVEGKQISHLRNRLLNYAHIMCRYSLA